MVVELIGFTLALRNIFIKTIFFEVKQEENSK